MKDNATVCPWCFGTFTWDMAEHDHKHCKISNLARLVAEREFLSTGKWPVNTPPMRTKNVETNL